MVSIRLLSLVLLLVLCQEAHARALKATGDTSDAGPDKVETSQPATPSNNTNSDGSATPMTSAPQRLFDPPGAGPTVHPGRQYALRRKGARKHARLQHNVTRAAGRAGLPAGATPDHPVHRHKQHARKHARLQHNVTRAAGSAGLPVGATADHPVHRHTQQARGRRQNASLQHRASHAVESAGVPAPVPAAEVAGGYNYDYEYEYYGYYEYDFFAPDSDVRCQQDGQDVAGACITEVEGEFSISLLEGKCRFDAGKQILVLEPLDRQSCDIDGDDKKFVYTASYTTRFGSKRLLYVDGRADQSQSEGLCQQLGGTLLTMEFPDERDFVRKQTNAPEDNFYGFTWLGLTAPAAVVEFESGSDEAKKSYTWTSSGEPLRQDWWEPGEPYTLESYGPCAGQLAWGSFDAGGWWTSFCSGKAAFVCQLGCTEVSLGVVADAHWPPLVCDGASLDASCVATCNTGYKPGPGGPPNRTCTGTTWGALRGNCIEATCRDPPQKQANIDWSGDCSNVKAGFKCGGTCQSGTVAPLNATAVYATCELDATLTNTFWEQTGNCSAGCLQRDLPFLPNGDWTCNNLAAGLTCFATCKVGFTGNAAGYPRVRCQSGNTWSSIQGYCMANQDKVTVSTITSAHVAPHVPVSLDITALEPVHMALVGATAACPLTPDTTPYNVKTWACSSQGTTCIATCRDNYGPGVGKSVTATCTSGQWTVSGSCKQGLCPGNPSAISSTRGVWRCTGGTRQEQCYATCNAGFAAKTASTCLSGVWTTVTSTNACASCSTSSPCCDKSKLVSPGAQFTAISTRCGSQTLAGNTCSGTCALTHTGSPSARCNNDRTWTYLSECSETGCPASSLAPTGPGAQAFSCPAANNGVQCTGACQTTYTGTVTATCQSTTWVVTSVNCAAGPGTPCTGEPAKPPFVASWACANGACTATCQTAYGPGIGKSVTAACTSGQWAVSGSCKLGLCPGNPLPIPSGTWSCIGGTQNERCYATCANGATTSVYSDCTSGSIWGAAIGSCSQTTTGCPSTTLTLTGAQTFSCPATTTGGTCVGACAPGTHIGTVNATCQGTVWVENNKCTLRTGGCTTNPPEVPFTTLNCLGGAPSVSVNTTCSGVCQEGSVGDVSVKCGVGGVWEVPRGRCTPTICLGNPDIDVQNGSWSCGSRTPIGGVCTAQCQFPTAGQPTTVCTAKGWSQVSETASGQCKVRRPIGTQCGGRSGVPISVGRALPYEGCGGTGRECKNSSWSAIGCEAGTVCTYDPFWDDWLWICQPPGSAPANQEGVPCGGEVANQVVLRDGEGKDIGVAAGCGVTGRECHDAPWSGVSCGVVNNLFTGLDVGLICKRDANYDVSKKWTCVDARGGLTQERLQFGKQCGGTQTGLEGCQPGDDSKPCVDAPWPRFRCNPGHFCAPTSPPAVWTCRPGQCDQGLLTLKKDDFDDPCGETIVDNEGNLPKSCRDLPSGGFECKCKSLASNDGSGTTEIVTSVFSFASYTCKCIGGRVYDKGQKRCE